MKSLKNKKTQLALLSLSTFIIVLISAEFASRLITFEKTNKYFIFLINYKPYLGFINKPNCNVSYNILNQFTKEEVECSRSTNNWGFREDIDYTFFLKKEKDAKAILILGGSAVGGAGSSTNDHVIDAVLQRQLNEKSKTKYVVYNFGNGGWVSFQEILGVLLFGFYLDPEWIIIMNGRNDVAVGMDSREGPLAFKHNAVIESFIKGYLQYGMNSSFYRGEAENWIIEKSKLYRMLTGKKYIPQIQNLFQKNDKIYVGQKTSWQDLDEIIQLYIKNIEILEKLFPRTKIIASLQPLCHKKKDIFKKLSSTEVQQQIDKGSDITYHTAIQYFYTNLLNRKTKAGNKIIYAGDAFPDEFDPQTYFLDEAHLTDLGVEKTAEFYSNIILHGGKK